MDLLTIVQDLETRSIEGRSQYICAFLEQQQIGYTFHRYESGRNILVNHKSTKPLIVISSHFDVVPLSPGANDNASAIAVCLAILNKLESYTFVNFDVAVYFFDEEEHGLRGSKAYVRDFGIDRIKALINLELVGQGDRFALWPVNDLSAGQVLGAFEEAAHELAVTSHRFDQIVTNSADHISFQKAGLVDAFTITCVSESDLHVAYHYYRALEFDVDKSVLQEIIQQAPLFQHYHKSTDLSTYLSEDSLQMTVNTIWNALIRLDN
ncbi:MULTISPECIES: M28 family peptidase [unclassified Spirosoma]|uniref:M28 family metallopeptidase n=1 Tax=unclassified Spirosoma TaxID=2621999 RepID=UPI000961FD1A|nr:MULTISPECIES: M28 family peptidase [unclassified Spirosoma]MBN8826863.1 M28 family peptidase [Spirosoma sp.]OJW75543.1 MAG: hypothetical protein BGO59_08370 [Spirosoma sp. 48-14]